MPQRNTMSSYDAAALKAISDWKSPPSSWFSRAGSLMSRPFDKAGELVLSAPGIGALLQKTVNGIIDLGHDVASWSVRPSGIYESFRNAGHAVHVGEHVQDLELQDVDRLVELLGVKYKSLAATEGAATGVMGLPGIPVDILAVTTLNLRAVGEYATYYGFDVSTQQERLFAMNVLSLASSPSDSAKALAMAQLVQIAHDVAARKTWKELQKQAFMKALQGVAQALGIQLTKAKLAQIVPATGVVVGAGFNAYFTGKVSVAAYHLYRERFLAAKYGADIIDSINGA